MSQRVYLTNAIAYVNGDPHLGHALEFVQTDVIARHRRRRGDEVRYLSGTDDNAIKNVRAAEAAGVGVSKFVSERAARFEALREPLQLSYDDFIRTATDPRHRPGVERLWRACATSGDLELRNYEGRYCAGCEAFVTDSDLMAGVCAEHGVAPEDVTERNWFFRLSRYREPLQRAIESGELQIDPPQRSNEVLGLLHAGLSDFSASRPRDRARGWGIAVPDDPEQVVYVWFDALANYITALGYGDSSEAFRHWWRDAGERVHVIGKGITRFHALYWPAMLLSAGEPLPTRILVHDYVTVDGQKLSKSLGNGADPVALAGRHGADGLRWWLLRDVPRSGDADFREPQLARRANELADGIGNLVNRTITLAARHPPQVTADEDHAIGDATLAEAVGRIPATVDAALARFDLRAAADAVWSAVEAANRHVSATRPWKLDGAERDAVLADLLAACRTIGAELTPFLPAASERIRVALETRDPALGRALYPKSAPAPRAPKGV
jgi:methionyl-tRNA synthetase